MTTETTAKYRKKPVVIEAFQLVEGSRLPDWFSYGHIKSEIGLGGIRYLYALIETLEGTMTADEGDWIIKGVQGEIYPCKPDIFEATYEPVTEEME